MRISIGNEMRRPKLIARQSGNPTGIIGWLIAGIMATETFYENKQALIRLDLKKSDQFLDVGTGHGTALAEASKKIRSGQITGIDRSPVMVRFARCKNRRQIAAGLTDVIQASSDDMPLAAKAFTKVLAVHTIYFWTDLAAHFNEISRITSSEGIFLLCFRPAEDDEFRRKFPDEVYVLRKKAAVLKSLSDAGFLVESVDEDSNSSRGHLVWVLARRIE